MSRQNQVNDALSSEGSYFTETESEASLHTELVKQRELQGLEAKKPV